MLISKHLLKISQVIDETMSKEVNVPCKVGSRLCCELLWWSSNELVDRRCRTGIWVGQWRTAKFNWWLVQCFLLCVSIFLVTFFEAWVMIIMFHVSCSSPSYLDLNKTLMKVTELTRRKIPGMASTWLEKPLALNIKCTTIAPTTAVMKVVHMRKASRYFRAVLGWNSNMKL